MAQKFFFYRISCLCVFALTLTSRTALSIPFVVFHGVSQSCQNEDIIDFISSLSNWSGSSGYCIEVGNGVWDSWTMPFRKQTSIACKKVKEMNELSKGYNIIGLSQGNIIGRGIIEFCDHGPPVKNLISLAGPHAGVASIPLCGTTCVCIIVDLLIEWAVYSDIVQEHLAPANYVKIPTDLSGYKKGCKFLPKLNNEFDKKAAYKQRFSSLQNLVLIMFEKDNVLVPRETSWFGYYPDGSWDTILPAQETNLYTEDWIGLKELDEAGKVKFIKTSGTHFEITYDEMEEHILPYLLDNSSFTTQHRISESSHLRQLPARHEKKTLTLYDAPY